MVENKETRSQSPRQPLRHSYTLADGQRIPVLFRMKNIQSAAVASARTGTSSTKSQKVSTEPNKQVTQAVANNAPSIPPEPTLSGPSWLRRNAYRFTVAVLLIVTFLVLNNNQEQVATNVAKDDVALEAPVVELGVAEPVRVTTAVVTTDPQPTSTIEVPKVEMLRERKPVTIAPPALAQNSPVKDEQEATVETTETESTTVYVISKPATDLAKNSFANTSDTSANEGGFNTSAPLAATTLLAPQTLAKPVAEESNFSHAPASELPSSTSGVPATAVSTNVNKDPELHASTTQNNRYATAPGGSAWTTPESGPQSTNEPNLDPSVLFAIKKSYQVNSLEQTVRDMRQQAQTQAPPVSPSANQWQAIPASSTLPPNAFAPRNNMGLQNPAQPPANASNVPQQNSPQNVPRRSAYEPLGPSLGLPTDSSLYPDATTPDGSPTANVPTKREPYRPLYNQSQPQPGTNYGSPSGTNNNLYETADQSFMGN